MDEYPAGLDLGRKRGGDDAHLETEDQQSWLAGGFYAAYPGHSTSHWNGEWRQ